MSDGWEGGYFSVLVTGSVLGIWYWTCCFGLGIAALCVRLTFWIPHSCGLIDSGCSTHGALS